MIGEKKNERVKQRKGIREKEAEKKERVVKNDFVNFSILFICNVFSTSLLDTV
jgi:hypothetical protein